MPAVRTCIGYGYQLGGPGAWNLHNVTVGGALRTVWFDETVPTMTFERGALTCLAARLGFPTVEHAAVGLPVTILEALKLSPPGWSRESSAPPSLGSALPADSDLLSPDRVAPTRYALIIMDSFHDLDDENWAMHREGEDAPDPDGDYLEDPNLDWDRVLLDTMATLGLEPVGMPDWLWAHVRWSHTA